MLNKKVKEDICKILEQYKQGNVYTYRPYNKEKQIANVKPYFHNSTKLENGRRYRFNICNENNCNKITLNDDLKNSILSQIKTILNNYNISYKELKLTSYYPYMESRMEYANWISCLEIYE